MLAPGAGSVRAVLLEVFDRGHERLTAMIAERHGVAPAQVVVGAAAAVIAGMLAGKSASAWSAFYGCLAVVIPGALFARGLRSQFSSISAVTAGFGFFVWEAVKIGVSVAMLAVAPRMVADE